MQVLKLIGAALLAALMLGTGVARAQDRHENYYYPPVSSSENYGARARVMDSASRQVRIGFVTELTKLQLEAPYPPQYAIFAKGQTAEKLIITGLSDDMFRTLYRARGVLAQMTAQARTTELFRSRAVEDYLTFLDLLKMLGFQRLTVTNGVDFTHQITLN